MSLSTSLNAICDLLREPANMPVHLGAPRAGDSGLYVWPYRLGVSLQARSPEVRFSPPQQTRGVSIDYPFLIVAHPVNAEASLDALEATIRTLIAHPVVTLPVGRVEVIFDARLTPADLFALHAAAGVPPAMALELVARTTLG